MEPKIYRLEDQLIELKQNYDKKLSELEEQIQLLQKQIKQLVITNRSSVRYK